MSAGIRIPGVKPSWRNGFARSARESIAPELWKGNIGLWAPSLGVTGNKLMDVSGYGGVGTLTDMDPAEDWVSSQHGMTLRFDGANQRVAIAPAVAASTEFAMSAVVKVDDATPEECSIQTVNGFMHVFAEKAYMLSWDNRTGTGAYHRNTALGSVVDNEWTTLGITGTGASFAAYINGVYVGTHNQLATTPSNYSATMIGAGLDGTKTELVGNVLLAACWNRGLAAAEHRALADNYNALLTPRDNLAMLAAATQGGGAPPATDYFPTRHALLGVGV